MSAHLKFTGSLTRVPGGCLHLGHPTSFATSRSPMSPRPLFPTPFTLSPLFSKRAVSGMVQIRSVLTADMSSLCRKDAFDRHAKSWGREAGPSPAVRPDIVRLAMATRLKAHDPVFVS